jgi:hypothetical protein
LKTFTFIRFVLNCQTNHQKSSTDHTVLPFSWILADGEGPFTERGRSL